MTALADSFDVAVIGAGPAGVAAACGLRSLGIGTVLFGESRNTSVEGVSERTLARLRAAGLESAGASVMGPGERTGTWGAAGVAAGREYLVERSVFDAALAKDAADAGVERIAESVVSLKWLEDRWHVQMPSGVFQCRAVVDARGRHARGAPVRGPRLVSVSQRFSSERKGQVRTAVHAMTDGWCWLAEDGRCSRWLQLVCAPSAVQANADIALRIAESLREIPERASFLDGAVAIGAPTVRAAVAKMSPAAPSRGTLRIGDACIAMDPLSGHGIHEALVSARVAVAAIHRFLQSDDWDGVSQYMNERTQEIWERMTKNAAQFYGTQATHSPTPFWTQAASAYESLATAARIGGRGQIGQERSVPFALGG